MAQTLYDKLYNLHLVDQSETNDLIYVDRHIVHEVTSPQSFEGLRTAGRTVRRPDCTLATVDHNIPTEPRDEMKSIQTFFREKDSLTQVSTLEKNVIDFGLTYFGMKDSRQGIVHIIGPEQGFTLPGVTLVCGDSHTSTHGAFGALAFGIGTSEVEHVLATQTLIQRRAKNMKIQVDGELGPGVTSKDVILHIIGHIGTAGATGCAIEYCGSTVRSLSMEARMSMCNMSIEAGARCGIVAPDETTFQYCKDRPLAPKGELYDRAVAFWETLKSDQEAHWDAEVYIRAEDIEPTVSWGTSPQDVVLITGKVPDPALEPNHSKAAGMRRSLKYMGLEPNTPMEEIKIDKVFIGSCTNSRIEDLRAAAAIAENRTVAKDVYAMVVPGSGIIKKQAEAEGLDIIFKNAGFDWREAGCSMCLGMNEDRLKPQERCASTSNRNFEGRQGPGGRTHLMSPAMAAAAATVGHLVDVRKFVESKKRPLFTELIVIGTDSKQFLLNDNFAENVCENKTEIEHSAEPEQLKNPKGDGSGMGQFTVLKGVAAVLVDDGGRTLMSNVDTDKIIEARFLKTIKRTGLGDGLFAKLRYNLDGSEKPSFALNKKRNAVILLAGENFGCGSSREHAPWALKDFGIKCIIAPSFGDIFYNNCFKNGMLPISLSPSDIAELAEAVDANCEIEVSLPEQTVSCADKMFTFDVDAFRKHCLVKGLDDIGLTLEKVDLIGAYETKRSAKYPWLDGPCRPGPVSIGHETTEVSKSTSVQW